VNRASKQQLLKRLAKVRLIAFDVDGTLTDGTIFLGANDEFKGFNSQDGVGIRMLIESGIEVAFITGRKSEAVSRRASELGMKHCFQGVKDKRKCLLALSRKLGLAAKEVAAMGDDLPDFELFTAAEIKLCVANAAPDLRAVADWTSTHEGGRGAAREAAEMILKAQGKWNSTLLRYLLG